MSFLPLLATVAAGVGGGVAIANAAKPKLPDAPEAPTARKAAENVADRRRRVGVSRGRRSTILTPLAGAFDQTAPTGTGKTLLGQ